MPYYFIIINIKKWRNEVNYKKYVSIDNCMVQEGGRC